MNKELWKKRIMLSIVSIVLFYLGSGAYEELCLHRLRQTPESDKPKKCIYDGQEFKSQRAMEIFRAEEQRDKYYCWATPLLKWQALLVFSGVAGYCGGLFRFTVDTFMERKTKPYYFYGIPMGAALLGISALYPFLMLEGTTQFSLRAIFIVCFLGGCFFEKSHGLFRHLAQEIFKENGE